MMLSCNSTKPSIWGLPLSWKYIPHGLGASQRIFSNKPEKFNNLCFIWFLGGYILITFKTEQNKETKK